MVTPNDFTPAELDTLIEAAPVAPCPACIERAQHDAERAAVIARHSARRNRERALSEAYTPDANSTHYDGPIDEDGEPLCLGKWERARAAQIERPAMTFSRMMTATRDERDATTAAHADELEAIHARTVADLRKAGLSFADLIAFDFQNR